MTTRVTTTENGLRQKAIQVGVRRWTTKQISMLILIFAILFLGAGRIDWLWGWVQWLLLAASVVAQIVFVQRKNPGLIAERSRVQRGSKAWDVALTLFAAVALPFAAWVVAAYDVRNGWTTGFPPVLNLAGAALFAGGYALTLWAMATNAFFSATVRIQSDRGHTVCTDGPYRLVRHPGYLGAIVFQIGSSLLLGSWPSLAPSLIACALYAVRTALEDATLKAELPGYADYAMRTRSRLIPGVW